MTERKQPRTFKVGRTTMTGDDVKGWQQDVKELFRGMGIHCPIKADGKYGVATRGFTASLCRALGLESAEQAMVEGVTPQLRIKLRNKRLSAVERGRFNSKERTDYRRGLRERWNTHVHAPTRQVITDDWGFHRGLHDGVDIVTRIEQPLYAICEAKVIDVRADGWWGLGRPSNPDVADKGDGIIQLQPLVSVGPIVKGVHIGYGHAEKACVDEGDKVEAGQLLGMTGMANAWHIHFMVNNGKTKKGIGDRDPRPIIDYCNRHG
jgi:murein DD-endopeptidase MepM/ murein hydrolase activator NlpD